MMQEIMCRLVLPTKVWPESTGQEYLYTTHDFSSSGTTDLRGKYLATLNGLKAILQVG